jgi:hypothetical protein
MYNQFQGKHYWSTAGTSTAGSAISFTQAMTLNASGQLGIGTTTPAGKLTVAESVNSGTANVLYLSNPSQTGTTAAAINFINADSFVKASIVAAVYGNDYMTFNVGSNTERMRLDASGNLGLGVTPSAWVAYTGFQIGTQGSIGATSTVINFGQNVYYGASGNSYIANGNAAMYQMNDGVHGWRIAGTGTAGNAITFTQAMTLFSTGNLAIATTTDSGYKLDVNGTGRFSGALTVTAGIQMNGTGGYGILARADGHNTAANGAYIGFVNNAFSRYFISQLDTSNDINYHYFNGSSWSTSIMKFSNTGSITATSFFESSSIKGKDIIATNPLLALDIDVIKYTRKSDESKDIRYGYSAEQIHSLMPELTDKDVTAVKYLDVHTILISQLQKEIKELKAKMN